MPSPITARGVLGHFLHSIYLPSVFQSTSPLSVRFPVYFPLQVILVGGYRGGWAQGGAAGRRSLKEGGDGGMISGAVYGDIKGVSVV